MVEEVMLDYMYDLPDAEPNQTYVVTPEIVRGEADLLDRPQKESA